jgi:CelD/BcsL family acetyltransferase involved in cellulose biosynthesis
LGSGGGRNWLKKDEIVSDSFAYSAQQSADEASNADVQCEAETPVISGEWRIETLKSLADIRRNAFRWIALEEQSKDPQAVFQGFAWCEAWAETYCKPQDSSCEPRIFFISRGETLVAILPMMLETHMGAKVLTLFGEPHSQLANALIHSEIDSGDGLTLCLAQAALLAGADVMALGPIPEDSPVLACANQEFISSDPAESISICRWPDGETVDGHLKTLTRNTRKNFYRRQRRMEEEGSLQFQQFTPLDSEFKSLVQKSLDWKRDWLERSGAFSLGLSMSGVDAFLSGFSGRDTVFKPVLDVLFVDDEPISISINIVGHGTLHCYLSAHNHEFSDLSPGTLATHMAIHKCIETGESGYSFLGFPTQFKSIWTNESVPLLRYHHALTLRGKIWLQLWTRGLRPVAKRVLTYARSAAHKPVLGKVLNGFLNLLSKQRGKR